VTIERNSDPVSTRALGFVALASLVIITALAALAWLLVVPPATPHHASARTSPLEGSLFDDAYAGEASAAAGRRRLDKCEWVDRSAHVARIPVERAIDAVVADPSLIAVRNEVTR
jgi:hypothetical protein